MPDGPGGFAQDSTCPALLRVPLRFAGLRVRGCRPLWRRFPAPSPRLVSCDLAALQPRGRLDAPGLGYSPSARRYSGNHSLFSLPAGTKMFQFPAFASGLGRMAPTRVPGCPIRTSADQRLLAPPRGFSQLATSFIACESLGIHRAPLHVSSPSCGHPPGEAARRIPCLRLLWIVFSTFCSCFRLVVPNMSMTSRPDLSGTRVENDGFEPSAPCLQGRCSSQLS